MNEDYLIKLHQELGVKDDFNTWLNAVKDNDEYLSKVHQSLGVVDNFNIWKSKVIGENPKQSKALSNEVKEDDFVSSIPGLKEKLTSVSKNYDPKKPYMMQDLFLKVEQADPIHTSTFAVDKYSLDISMPTESIGPGVSVNTTIRPVGDAELSMEEDEAIEAYKKSYGHLGFTFKTSGFGFDYVTIKHKNDTGKGITVSHDQWYFISDSDKKEFNDYLGKYSKNLTQEQIDKTHNLSKHAQDIINIKSGVKTPEDLEKIEQNAIDDIDGNSTMQKISSFLETLIINFLVLGQFNSFYLTYLIKKISP
jgi:hypothetical protein